MKSVKISFVQPALYRWIWGVVALTACVLFAGFIAKAYQIRSEGAVLSGQLHELQTKIQTLQASTRTSSSQALLGMDAAKMRQASQISLALQSDLGKALRTIETLKIPAVRLRNLAIDNAQGTINIDLELGSLAQASVVSEALAAGYKKSPWVLISATAQGAGSAASEPGISVAVNPAFLGKWRAKLAEL
jgi:hypothetical protein